MHPAYRFSFLASLLIFSPSLWAFTLTASLDTHLELSASHRFEAKNSYLPLCAVGYLGGGSHGKRKYQELAIVRAGTEISVSGEVDVPHSLICDYEYKDSSLQITVADQTICQDTSTDTDLNCVWPAHISINPQTDNGANLQISCKLNSSTLPSSKPLRSLECERK